MSWDVEADQVIADICDLMHRIKGTSPSKRNAISLTMRFYDPQRIISPITVRFKHLFQKMCEEELDWDEPLTGELLDKWE